MNDNKLNTIVCEGLDKEVNALSAEIRSKLTRRRVSLVERRHALNFSFFKPKGIALFASLALVAFVSSYTVFQTSDVGGKPELVATIDSLEENLTEDELNDFNAVDTDVGDEFFLTEEDLDFFDNLDLYQWLDSEFKLS